MSNFSRMGDGFALDLTLDEAHILINLVEQLLELLGDSNFEHHYSNDDPLAQLMGLGAEVPTPEDPVLLRLLPNAYADPEASADFRRYTEPTLRRHKSEVLRSIRTELALIVDEIGADQLSNGGRVEELDGDIWLVALNDLRLALSVRLNIEADSFDTFELLPDDDPQKAVYAVYFWLGWLQENLLAAMIS